MDKNTTKHVVRSKSTLPTHELRRWRILTPYLGIGNEGIEVEV